MKPIAQLFGIGDDGGGSQNAQSEALAKEQRAVVQEQRADISARRAEEQRRKDQDLRLLRSIQGRGGTATLYQGGAGSAGVRDTLG